MQVGRRNQVRGAEGTASVGRGVALAALGSLLVVMGAGIVRAGGRGPGRPTDAAADEGAARAKFEAAYGELPMSFEANAGQTDAAVDFVARGEGYSLFLTPSEAVLSLTGRTGRGGSTGDRSEVAATAPSVIRMQLRGANAAATPVHGVPLPGRANYLIGGDRSQWRTGVPTFGEVAYQGVYPGIDLSYHGTRGQLEYDFVVAPGADPAAIRLAVSGADGLRIAPEGDLVITTAGGEVRQHKPVAFQDVGGQRRGVSADFVLGAGGEVSLGLGGYDTSAPLVIDPTLGYSTYFGGTANDFGFGIAVDAAGNAYLGGQTASATFPRGGAGDPAPKGATAGAFQTAFGGGSDDAFVLKLNPAGTSLVYSTYLGGAGTDAGFDLAIDAAGNAYLAGATDSADDPGTTAVEKRFPTTDGTGGTVAAFDATCGTDGLCNNVLPPNFSVAACDPLEPACNPANPASPGFLPPICPPDANPGGCPTPPGPADDFLAKLSPTGDKLLYSTLFGGSSAEQNADQVPYSGQMGLALNGVTAYITATTFSADFPTTAKAFQPACASCAVGNNDAYLTVLDTSKGGAAGLVYSTFVGGSGFDEGKGVAVDAAGSAYLTGVITGVDPTPGSTTFPVKNPLRGRYLGSGAYTGDTYKGGYSDAYVTKIDPSAASPAATLVWSSFLGGGSKEEGWSVAVAGNPSQSQVFITGYTSSGKNPHGQVADPAHPGACAAAPDPSGIRPFCDFASDAAPYFPITPGAYQATFAGRASTDSSSTLFLDGDAFVARIVPDGSRLAYSTFLGGPNADYGQSIAVDSRFQAYVTGWTTCRSQDPPGTGGVLDPPPQFDPDGLPTGRNPGEPAATGVGDCPTGFPTVNAPAGLGVMNSTNIDNHINDSPTGAFVTKLLPTGAGVVYSLLLDGRGFDRGFTVAVREPSLTAPPEAYISGRTGNASVVAGCVPSCPFPITPGSYDTTFNGAGRDAFITKLIG